MGNLLDLPPFDGELLNAIIEAPMGSRNKFTYDEKLELFRLKKVLPAGHVFPFDFGFVPGTWAEDDGPLDVLVWTHEPAFPGCLVPCRLLGALEAKQTKSGKVVRNDRLIAVPDKAPGLDNYRRLKDLPQNTLLEVEQFFVSYNAAEGRKFRVVRRSDTARARRLVEEGVRAFRAR